METITRQEINDAADTYADDIKAELLKYPGVAKLGDDYLSALVVLNRRSFIEGLLTAFQAHSIQYEDPFAKPSSTITQQ